MEQKLYELIRLLLTKVHVDETWYREMYRDVEDAIRKGTMRSAREHYITAGYFEDRLPHSIIVDVEWYLENNPDVAEGIRLGKIASAEEHFQMAGFKEGRLPCPDWTLIGLERNA